MVNFYRIFIGVVFFVFFQAYAMGQSLTHPHIWVSDEDKQQILDNIATYEWAQSLFNQYENRIDNDVNTHKSDPSVILNTIPGVPGLSSDRTKHTDILASASEASILYYLTDDLDYAQYAADILNHYMQRLAVQESRKYAGGTGLFFSDWWIESRALYPKIAIMYDFLYNYVNSDTITCYDLNTGSRISFDNNVAQTTVRLLSDVVLKSIGARNSNWSVLAGNGALFNLMMIDDDGVRESFFKRFYNQPNNEQFDAYQWTLSNFTNQNIWNETYSYSRSVSELVTQSLNVIDRYKPELDILNKNIRILEGMPFYENMFYPSGQALRFGDSGTGGNSIKGYQWILKAATRKNLTDYIDKTKQALKYEYNERGGYNPKVITDRLGWWGPLELLWGINVEDTITAMAPELERSVPINHAGIMIQRNYNTGNVEMNGLMCYTGGASYVHAHKSGIDMELYGKGLVFGGESGSGSYGSDEHENYRTRLASHNTIIVNGSGKGGNGWSTRMNKVKTEVYEPRVGDEPVSTKFSFSTQSIDDTYNNCKQQRTVSIIRIDAENGYYFDLFRSKGNATDDSHDYIYHNIGDLVTLANADNSALPLSASTKYATDISGSITGWKFFENVQSSTMTNEAVKATFHLNTNNAFMHVAMPKGVDREYAKALAPETKGAQYGYESKKTPVITIRQKQEAWNKPFIAIYEPSLSSESTIQSVENIEWNGEIIGAVVSSMINGKEITDYIISLEKEDSVYIPEHFIGFKGRFGIVRKEKQSETTETVTLYIGQGDKLEYADITLYGEAEKRAEEKFYGVPQTTGDASFTLDLDVFGGGGTISVSPDKESYLPGEQVQVQAEPDYCNVLDEWLGDAYGSDRTYTLTMFSNKSVFARFRVAEYVNLNIATENGNVSQSSPGTQFCQQTEIELTANANDGYAFDSWDGDYKGTENPLLIRLDSSINITANFVPYTSLHDKSIDAIRITPNPSAGLFVVSTPIAVIYSVYNITGQLILSGMADSDFNLDMRSQQSGVYLLKLETEDDIIVKKIKKY